MADRIRMLFAMIGRVQLKSAHWQHQPTSSAQQWLAMAVDRAGSGTVA